MISRFGAFFLLNAVIASSLAQAIEAKSVVQPLINKTPKTIQQASSDLELAIRTGDVAGYKKWVIAPLEAVEKSFGNGSKCDAAFGQNEAKYRSCYACEMALRYFKDYAETFSRQEDVELLKYRKNREAAYKQELTQCRSASK